MRFIKLTQAQFQCGIYVANDFPKFFIVNNVAFDGDIWIKAFMVTLSGVCYAVHRPLDYMFILYLTIVKDRLPPRTGIMHNGSDVDVDYI